MILLAGLAPAYAGGVGGGGGGGSCDVIASFFSMLVCCLILRLFCSEGWLSVVTYSIHKRERSCGVGMQ